jgi:hypothetical protein
MIEIPIHFQGSLSELLSEIQSKFPSINWSIHESEAYFTGRYILGKLGTTKITIEAVEENRKYELSLS